MAAIDTPRSVESFKETLKDPDKLKTLTENPDNLELFFTDYAKAMMNEGGIKGQVEEAMKEGMQKFLIENRGQLAKGRLDAGDPDGETEEWSSWSQANINGAKVGSAWGVETFTPEEFKRLQDVRKRHNTHGFNSPSEFYKAIFHRNLAMGDVDARLKDLSINIGADGGFLIPESLRAELLQVPLEAAIVRPRAMIVPMDSLTVPFPTIDDTSHASNVYGGIVANWTDENTTITENQPTFGRVVLQAKKLALYTEVPNELFQDSIISLEAFLNQIYPLAIAYFEDDAFLVGTGAGQPLGVLNAANPALVTQSRDTANEVNWDDLVNMFARMLPSSIASAIWPINQEVFPQLATMSLDVGTGGSAVWLSNGVAGPPATILGRPVVITEKVPALGSQADISFVDFRQYLLGDRQTLTMMTSPHFKFQQDQTAIRATERVDGQPWMRSAITPRNGTNTLSPYVALAA